MNYQVLARKWRPRSFREIVGQAHVVRALTNALDRDRLHHAYLFSGTRGVGKTTLARILAKALNCEQGVGSTPCGQCSACREIDEGRFVDLIEVDAASRTKVEQTRELLDNVPFAPVKGRYKVYLIDEVHMFSASSFNALLKTLEEPPDHVRFLLATTDPQRVPATILSRCLQFRLRHLTPEEIGEQLARILTAEKIPFDAESLKHLARAAAGSMRDGLSLLDQSIAYGAGRLVSQEVQGLLGTVGREHSIGILRAIAQGDGPGLLERIARVQAITSDFHSLLEDLLGLLHRVALYQQVPSALGPDEPDREAIVALAQMRTPEAVQLDYQIALLGQRDLGLAPDAGLGLEMVLLRMLAFRPLSSDAYRESPAPTPRPETKGTTRDPNAPDTKPASRDRSPPDGTNTALETLNAIRKSLGKQATRETPRLRVLQPAPSETSHTEPEDEPRAILGVPEDWHRIVYQLAPGPVRELAANASFERWDGDRLILRLGESAQRWHQAAVERELERMLKKRFGREQLILVIQTGSPAQETPAQHRARRARERRIQAERVLDQDPIAQALIHTFDAHWISDTIGPPDPEIPEFDRQPEGKKP